MIIPIDRKIQRFEVSCRELSSLKPNAYGNELTASDECRTARDGSVAKQAKTTRRNERRRLLHEGT